MEIPPQPSRVAPSYRDGDGDASRLTVAWPREGMGHKSRFWHVLSSGASVVNQWRTVVIHFLVMAATSEASSTASFDYALRSRFRMTLKIFERHRAR